MTDFNRLDAFRNLSDHNLSFLTKVSEELGENSDGLNNHAVKFAPLMGRVPFWSDAVWDGSLNGVPNVYNLDEIKKLELTFLEKGTPFVNKEFLADIVTEIQMMLPEFRVTIVPKVKVEYEHNGDNPLDVSHLLSMDNTLGFNCLHLRYDVHHHRKEIVIATAYHGEDILRSAYQAVWNAISPSIWPQWVADAEKERMDLVSGSEFTSLGVSMPLEQYEARLDNAQPDHSGRFDPVVREMLQTAGVGFVNYASNLRLLHAVPYIYLDEDTDEMVHPRFASIYHRILNGDGGSFIRAHWQAVEDRKNDTRGGRRAA